MAFKDKLLEVMCEMNLTQAQVSGMTGIGKSSISQYLSGKNVPTEKRQREIATSLGLDADWFNDDAPVITEPLEIDRMTPEEAGKILGMSKETIRAGLREGVFPWGYAVKGNGGRWVYFINAKRFMEIERCQH